MKNFHLSDSEKKIISLLRQDSRLGYKEIAQKTGVAISTVHNTIKRLTDQKVIKNFSIKLNSEMLGYDLTVIIGVQVKHGSLKDVEAQLVQHPNVCQVFIVTGEHDIIMVAKFESTAQLNDFVREFLQKAIGAERTNTSVVLNTAKERLNPTFNEFD